MRENTVVVGYPEIAGTAPACAPAVPDEICAVSRRFAREIRCGVVVVPSDYGNRVISVSATGIVVGSRRGFVVGAGMVVGDIERTALHHRLLDGIIVEGSGLSGNPDDPLDMAHGIRRLATALIRIGVGGLVHRTAPTRKVCRRDSGVAAVVEAPVPSVEIGEVVFGKVHRRALATENP